MIHKSVLFTWSTQNVVRWFNGDKNRFAVDDNARRHSAAINQSLWMVFVANFPLFLCICFALSIFSVASFVLFLPISHARLWKTFQLSHCRRESNKNNQAQVYITIATISFWCVCVCVCIFAVDLCHFRCSFCFVSMPKVKLY